MQNKKKTYSTLAIFIIISLFLVVLVIWPILNGIKRNSVDLISAKNSIATLEARVAATNNFKKSYADYKTNLDKIDQLFVSPDNPVDFIKFLEDTASDCDITSQVSPSFSKDYQKSAQNFVTFQMNSIGSFSGLLEFSKEIESGPYMLEIESLTIQDSGGTSKVEKFSASFAIKVFTK